MRPRRTFYVLETHVQGCVAEISLNDQPIIRRGDADGMGRYYGGPCNHSLIPGENVLSVLIEPGPTPAQAESGAPRARRALEAPAEVSARLVRYLEREVVGSPAGEVLIDLAWESPELAGALPWPRVIAGRADLGPLFGRWKWQDVAPLTLDPPTVAAVRTLLVDFHAALRAKDLDTILALSRIRLDDISRAYQLPAGQQEAEIRQNTQFYMDEPSWGVQPLDSGAFSLRLVGGRRMVDCVRTDWDPIVREAPRPPDGLANTWPLMVAPIDGTWRVVR